MEEAKAPGAPIRPRKARTITITAVVGLLVGLALAVGIEYFDTTVKSTDDVERYLGLPVIATVPAFSVKK
jgi:capsular polysaccharide biosynthesis protein